MTAEFDFSEVRVMTDALNHATRVAPAETMAVVTRGAFQIKEDAQRRVTGLRHAPRYPWSITFDRYVSLTGPAAEIGPDKNRPQGALGNILEFGTSKNAPIPHMAPAAAAEAPRFAAALEVLAVKALGPGFS